MTWEPWSGLLVLLALIGLIGYEVTKPKSTPQSAVITENGEVPTYNAQLVTSSAKGHVYTVWEYSQGGWKAKESYHTPVASVGVN